MYLVDRIEWKEFYDQLTRIVTIWDEIKGDEDNLKPIVQKQNERNNDITSMCISVIQLPCHQIEKIFYFLNRLEDFDSKWVYIQKRITICLSKYIAERFDLFPSALEKVDRIKEKEEWEKELDEILCQRMNNVINEKGHILWAMNNEELVKVQLFYKSIRKDLIEIEAVGNSIIKVQREILNFDWPDDTTFNEWKEKILSIEQMAKDDGVEEDVELTVTLIVHDEDNDNPRVEVRLQVIEHDTSLSSLIATYSEESE